MRISLILVETVVKSDEKQERSEWKTFYSVSCVAQGDIGGAEWKLKKGVRILAGNVLNGFDVLIDTENSENQVKIGQFLPKILVEVWVCSWGEKASVVEIWQLKIFRKTSRVAYWDGGARGQKRKPPREAARGGKEAELGYWKGEIWDEDVSEAQLVDWRKWI